MEFSKKHPVYLAPDYPIELDLLDIGNGFHIYSFDMTGECEWNRVAARELQKKLEAVGFRVSRYSLQ